MAKEKKTVVQPSDVLGPKSVIPEGKEGGVEVRVPLLQERQQVKVENGSVRILFHGKCPKLTPRGVGNLEYEIGIDEEKKEGVLRITRNESSGAFSTHWIGLKGIRTVVEALKGEPFRGVILRDLFTQKSSNNHGFLAAVLKKS